MYTILPKVLLNGFPDSGCITIKKKKYVYSLFLYFRNNYYFILMFSYFEIIIVIK